MKTPEKYKYDFCCCNPCSQRKIVATTMAETVNEAVSNVYGKDAKFTALNECYGMAVLKVEVGGSKFVVGVKWEDPSEHAALVAVAEAAEETARVVGVDTDLGEALSRLAAVRAGQPQPRNTEPSAVEIELVAVEFGFKCCEKGMNLDATFEKLKQMKRAGNGGAK